MARTKGPNVQQKKAAALREAGAGGAEIARELGLANKGVAKDVLKTHDALVSGKDIKRHILDTMADPPTTIDEKVAARIRSKKQLAGTKIKTESETARVLRMMEDARVLALTFLDAETLQKESGRGLAQILNVLTGNIQLLKGEPTTITRIEDVRSMDNILKVLQDEIKKRNLKEEKVINEVD